MEQPFTESQTVTGSEDKQIGRVTGFRDGCVLVETGHVFKSMHAIPESFLHVHDDEIRATVSKDIVDSSPKVDGDDWDHEAVLRHYGLSAPFEVDPDPDAAGGPEVEGERHGVEAAPRERIKAMEGAESPDYRRPTVHERQANPNDPAGVTANLRERR